MDLCGGKYISIIKMGNTPLIEVIFINHYKPYGMLHFFFNEYPTGCKPLMKWCSKDHDGNMWMKVYKVIYYMTTVTGQTF